MHLITGAHKMSCQDHLLAECNFLPVSEELSLSCCQFLASASRVKHPSHSVIQLPTGERWGRKGIVHTLQSRFSHEVQPYLTNGILPSSNYKKTIKAIHTKVVARNKQTLRNKILGRTPPEIEPLEDTLPRHTRAVLCQLREGYSGPTKSDSTRHKTIYALYAVETLTLQSISLPAPLQLLTYLSSACGLVFKTHLISYALCLSSMTSLLATLSRLRHLGRLQ
jgi:hypothetical protein